jgi:two-component system KDP operon response regulator KdpE
MKSLTMPEGNPSILLVDDEPQILRYLRAALGSHGFQVLEAVNAQECETLAASHRPDVILLDLGLPDLDGILLTRKLREWCDAPIIVISARGQEEDKIQALDAGADDYLTKPFGTGELLARIRVALRRSPDGPAPLPPPVFQLGNWSVNQSLREVRVESLLIHLTPNEYKLLTTLVKHAGKVLTHKQLLKEVWGDQPSSQPHYLRVYMAQLRHKLEADPVRPRYLITEPGVGYRLRTE